jgi:hypothetical protein
LLLEFVSIAIVSFVGFVPLRICAVVVAGSVPAVKSDKDGVLPEGLTSLDDSRAIVVSAVVGLKFVVLPPSVEESSPSVGSLTALPPPLAGVPNGQPKPQRSSVATLADDPVVGVPSQAARANADKTTSDADPIRMIFPTTQIIHR